MHKFSHIIRGPGYGLSESSVENLTEIFPEEVLSYDDLILRQDDGLKKLSIDDLAAALGTAGRGWTPSSLGSPVLALDPGRRDSLYLNTGRTTPALHNGTNELIAGITDLCGAGRHASQATSGDMPRYNSSALVAGRNYLENLASGDHMDLAAAWVPGASSGVSFWSVCWTAYLPTAALQANSSLMPLGTTETDGLSLFYDNLGRPTIHKSDRWASRSTVVAPLDEWHTVLITYGYANGMKMWVNGVAQSLVDTGTGLAEVQINRLWEGDVLNVFRSDYTGWNSGAGSRVGLIYANGIEFSADQVAQVNAWTAVRAGI